MKYVAILLFSLLTACTNSCDDLNPCEQTGGDDGTKYVDGKPSVDKRIPPFRINKV